MEQIVLVHASAYNDNQSLNTQAVTKWELPKHQAEQISTYKIDSLRKEINKKLFAKAVSLVDKSLSCPRIKPSNSHTLILDVVETGGSPSNFAQQLRRKNADDRDIYFTLLDAAGISPSLVLNQNAQAKKKLSWVALEK